MVGQDIRRARKRQGLTQEALAERLGVSRHSIIRLERGEASLGLVQAAVDALGLNLRALATA